MNSRWIQELQHFCERYDLEFENLTEVLSDPKVIPMIRGKSFEYSVKNKLDVVLDQHEFEIIKPYMNAQSDFHDIDIQIKNILTSKKYVVECKLAAKRSFRNNGGNPYLKVKCMRSRTLGKEAAKQKSKVTDKSEDDLMVHNDQYLSDDFDLVITSIANAFYDTDEEGLFYWNPTQNELILLHKLESTTQKLAFNKMYVAKSSSLTANENNSVVCTRRKCDNANCGFIPNYPIIKFDIHGNPQQPWFPLESIRKLLD